jgi:hypothetical protein|nr:MAG TPA: lipoprotein [Caudoviricetes sp.]
MKYIIISIFIILLTGCTKDRATHQLYLQLKESRDSLYNYKHKYYTLQREYLELQSKQHTH